MSTYVSVAGLQPHHGHAPQRRHRPRAGDLHFNVGRTTEQKVALYDRAAQLLAEAAGVSPDEVFINLVEVQREKWSFEKGVAQFVPQAETK